MFSLTDEVARLLINTFGQNSQILFWHTGTLAAIKLKSLLAGSKTPALNILDQSQQQTFKRFAARSPAAHRRKTNKQTNKQPNKDWFYSM